MLKSDAYLSVPHVPVVFPRRRRRLHAGGDRRLPGSVQTHHGQGLHGQAAVHDDLVAGEAAVGAVAALEAEVEVLVGGCLQQPAAAERHGPALHCGGHLEHHLGNERRGNVVARDGWLGVGEGERSIAKEEPPK